MISYQTYKLITESSFALGIKSKPSIGISGSRLQEMGFERDDNPDMLDGGMGDFPPEDSGEEMGTDDLNGGEGDMEGEMEGESQPCPACNHDGAKDEEACANDENCRACEACGGLGWLPSDDEGMGDEEMGSELDGGEEMGDDMDGMGGDDMSNADPSMAPKPMFSKKFMCKTGGCNQKKYMSPGCNQKKYMSPDESTNRAKQIGQEIYAKKAADPNDPAKDQRLKPGHSSNKYMKFTPPSRSASEFGGSKFMHKEESICDDDFFSSLTNQTKGPNRDKNKSGIAEDILIAMDGPTEDSSPGEVGFAPQGRLNQIGNGFSMDDFKEIPTLGQ